MMDFGLFHTWNAMYAGGKVPWDSAYSGGKLLEEDAYARNFVEVECGGGDGLGLYLARGRSLFQAGEHGSSGAHAGRCDRRPHQQDQDRVVRPPPGVEATRRDGIRTSIAT